jgi:hypothetical protein
LENLQNLSHHLSDITVNVLELIVDIVVENVGNKKAYPKVGFKVSGDSRFYNGTPLLFWSVAGSTSSQICQKNLFIYTMNRPQLKVSSDFAFYYKFIDSLLTDSDDSGYFFDRKVAGRFHYNSLPNTLLFFQKLSTPPSHINNQIFTTFKNNSLKLKLKGE